MAVSTFLILPQTTENFYTDQLELVQKLENYCHIFFFCIQTGKSKGVALAFFNYCILRTEPFSQLRNQALGAFFMLVYVNTVSRNHILFHEPIIGAYITKPARFNQAILSTELRAQALGPESLCLDPHSPFEFIGVLFNLSTSHFSLL